MMTFREAMNKTAQVKVYQWTAVLLAITVLWAGGIYGGAVYLHDQRAAQRAELVRSAHEVAMARYENDRDERTRCEQRVDGRSATRENAQRTYVLVQKVLDQFSALSGHPIPAEIQALLDSANDELDKSSPPLDIDDCPPVPTPPEPLNQ